MRCDWLAGVLGLAACGGDEVESVELGVSWTLLVGIDGVDPTPPCRESATIDIVAGDAGIEIPCSATGTATMMVEPGSYDVRIDVSDGNDLLARSDVEQVEVGAAGAVVDFDVPYQWGFIAFTWTLVDDAGAAITCDDIGASEIMVITQTPNTFIGWGIACDDRAPTPLDVEVGAITMCAALRDLEGNVIGNPFDLTLTIAYGNETEDLGELVFQVPPDEQGPTGLCGSFGP